MATSSFISKLQWCASQLWLKDNFCTQSSSFQIFLRPRCSFYHFTPLNFSLFSPSKVQCLITYYTDCAFRQLYYASATWSRTTEIMSKVYTGNKKGIWSCLPYTNHMGKLIGLYHPFLNVKKLVKSRFHSHPLFSLHFILSNTNCFQWGEISLEVLTLISWKILPFWLLDTGKFWRAFYIGGWIKKTTSINCCKINQKLISAKTTQIKRLSVTAMGSSAISLPPAKWCCSLPAVWFELPAQHLNTETPNIIICPSWSY